MSLPGKILRKAKSGALHVGIKVFVGGWWRDGLAGKHGVQVMQFLKSLTGLRSAIMAVVLSLEVVAQGLGFEAGPLFTILRTLFAGIGWDPKETVFDPTPVGAAIVTLIFAYKRFAAWLKTEKK